VGATPPKSLYKTPSPLLNILGVKKLLLYTTGGGSVLTQQQSHDMETDIQHNTRDGSSGRPSTLLQISYFIAKLQYTIFYNIILELGKTTDSQNRFPAIHG
jgi:hypothetical protein